MMNPSKHRYTDSQVRLHYSKRYWKRSGRPSEVFAEHEVLRHFTRPEKKHPAYRRRRLKHPAFYSIRYVRNWKIQGNRKAWFRFRKTEAEKEFSRIGLYRRHPSLRPKELVTTH